MDGGRARRVRRGNGQSTVEFVLVAPIAIAMILLLIDFSRLVYTYAAISWASREGARLVSLAPNINTDCPALRRVEQVGRGFPIVADPNSIQGNQDPNGVGSPGPTTPAAGQGYVYIYPAVASTPPDTNCTGPSRNPVAHDVAVEVQYGYTPIVPVFRTFIPDITIKTISVVHVEY
ncbi:MAG TPA: TadE/TadG family type IV pilus assembly protein [Candidatus Dormibacteraeota bacterium]|jgi:Flp pilus assembly protein TadG|nr:TadE/TadG family type IV pilus assembly protein [Candidatus Dormibacteraeota bacterium]